MAIKKNKKNIAGELHVVPGWGQKGRGKKFPIVHIESTDRDSGWWGTSLNKKDLEKLIQVLEEQFAHAEVKLLEEAK